MHAQTGPAVAANAQRSEFRCHFLLTVQAGQLALVNFRSSPAEAFFEQLQLGKLGVSMCATVQVQLDAVHAMNGASYVRLSDVSAGHGQTWLVVTLGRAATQKVGSALGALLGGSVFASAVMARDPDTGRFETMVMVRTEPRFRQKMEGLVNGMQQLTVGPRRYRLIGFTDLGPATHTVPGPPLAPALLHSAAAALGSAASGRRGAGRSTFAPVVNIVHHDPGGED